MALFQGRQPRVLTIPRGSLNAHTCGLPLSLKKHKTMRLIPKNREQMYLCALVLTLISFALFALGIHFDNPIDNFLQIVLPPILSIALREVSKPIDDDY